MHLNQFDYFRGISIIIIVSGHCSYYCNWKIDTFSEKVFANLLNGGSALFVFISGFLFYHVFYQNFNMKSFITKKFFNVYVPYLILSVLAIIYFYFYLDSNPRYFDIIVGSNNSFLNYFILGPLKYLWNGRVIMAYWYIPFIMIIFLCSPIFIEFIKLTLNRQLFIIIILSIISMLIHRPLGLLSVFQSVMYFLPVYLIGITVSIKREQIFEFLRGKEKVLGFIVVILAIMHVLIYDDFEKLTKNAFEYRGFDMTIIQSTFMCLFLISFLNKFEKRKLPILKYLASISFAIYFIHPWVMEVVIGDRLLKLGLTGPVGFVILSIVTIILCILLAEICKAILGHRSRLVIGW